MSSTTNNTGNFSWSEDAAAANTTTEPERSARALKKIQKRKDKKAAKAEQEASGLSQEEYLKDQETKYSSKFATANPFAALAKLDNNNKVIKKTEQK